MENKFKRSVKAISRKALIYGGISLFLTSLPLLDRTNRMIVFDANGLIFEKLDSLRGVSILAGRQMVESSRAFNDVISQNPGKWQNRTEGPKIGINEDAAYWVDESVASSRISGILITLGSVQCGIKPYETWYDFFISNVDSIAICIQPSESGPAAGTVGRFKNTMMKLNLNELNEPQHLAAGTFVHEAFHSFSFTIGAEKRIPGFYALPWEIFQARLHEERGAIFAEMNFMGAYVHNLGFKPHLMAESIERSKFLLKYSRACEQAMEESESTKAMDIARLISLFVFAPALLGKIISGIRKFWKNVMKEFHAYDIPA